MQGIWTCPCCARGEPKNNRPLRTAYEKFLFAPVDQEVLQLARITSFAKDRAHPGSLEVCVRYYCRPEATHVGRLDFEKQTGTEVYMCEYEYDEQWKRFRRFRSASNRKSASGIESKGRAKACGATDDVLDDLRHSDGNGSSEDDGSDFDADREESSSSGSSSEDDEDMTK
ncbi:hypothetical protein DUNSADRAFT_18407 [Dunaliella salina]|uniref:Uncharacterized protein n=1 Tax=Dunaliella salina TaxID=3046 RepID=A0ABQ7GZ59_DUNSA|nr:hypothetical protein DUNSADRAFT_18407 [Dunaliella salina]|eukprot:KAF5839864.1 hypothetical protein DUNSADRAFT_18407 [Dunaliella salina]